MKKTILKCFILLVLLTVPFIVSCSFADEKITEKQVIDIVNQAGKLIEQKGDDGVKEINNPKGNFIHGELYAFVYDEKVTMLANPFSQNLVGGNAHNKGDIRGKMFRDEIVNKALKEGSGWTTYTYKKPDESGLYEKKTYGKLFTNNGKKYIVCSGLYTGVKFAN